MKRIFYLFPVLLITLSIHGMGQTVTELAPDHYVEISISTGSSYRDYARAVILLHAIYDGQVISKNYAVGTVVALRGQGNDRTNIAYINTSSSHLWTQGSVTSINNYNTTNDRDEQWKLKKVRYNGILYIALEVPYRAYYHNMGFRFVGWTHSTSPENMKLVAYEDTKPGGAGIINTEIYNSMENFVPNNTEYHQYRKSVFGGKVGIGTDNPDAALTVKGNIHAQKVTVNLNGAIQPDYVFDSAYSLPSLVQLQQYIKVHHHLPGIASAREATVRGVDLGQEQTQLLKNIEELTLYVIQLNQQVKHQNKVIAEFRRKFDQLIK